MIKTRNNDNTIHSVCVPFYSLNRHERRVYALARGVRIWAADLRQKYGGLCGWNDDLECMCAICTFRLFEKINHSGYKAKFAASPNHAFVIWNSKIWDVTATQFFSDLPEVCVVSLSKIDELGRDYYFWDYHKTTFFRQKALDIISAWPDEQHPLEYVRYIRDLSS